MAFPLYHRPNSLVFLDDDANYLETLALVLPGHWNVSLFTHADDCFEFCSRQYALWKEDVWLHQQMVNRYQAGAGIIPQVLEYWQNQSVRYQLTQTCVADFAMPAMTGLEFLKKLSAWSVKRVLLTGKADELVAIGAFNEGLIETFIPKQHPQIGRHLTETLAAQHVQPMHYHEGIWRGALKPEQYAVLQESSVRLELRKIIQERQWIEYVVIPAPFGILGLDRQAGAHWLQLELRSGLDSMVDLAQAAGQSDAVIQKIKAATHFINAELLSALGSAEEPSIKTCFTIGKADSLLGALFSLAADKAYGMGHDEFLASAPPRVLTS